jgi:predicted Zn-dependent protease
MPNVLNRSAAAEPDDPIATPTIAAIYLRQGLPYRALKVYRNLLRNDPDNSALRRQLEELEARIRAEEERVRTKLEETTASDPLLVADRQVALLNLWLAAVRRRKKHVS